MMTGMSKLILLGHSDDRHNYADITRSDSDDWHIYADIARSFFSPFP